MSFLRFSMSRAEQESGEDDSNERTSLLDSIPASPISTIVPEEEPSPRLPFADNIDSYGSVNMNQRYWEELGPDFVDLEEGTNQNRSLVEDDNATPRVETVRGENDGNNNSNNTEQQATNGTSTSEDDDEVPRDGAIGNITRRLRCLFSAITFPIVPLGTVVSLALIWVLYAATSLDFRKTCSHPLHSYAFMSILLVVYIPNHAMIRSQIFHYSRERDGPVRPTRVRMYDQFFHTICLIYVYTGATLMETCTEDIIDPNSSAAYDNYEQLQLTSHIDTINTCEATCPSLYQAMSVYVATLEIFTSALILPLLFLPCIYLWFLQRATAEADAFARLQDRLQDEEALLSNGGITTGEILNNLEVVKIISKQQQSKSNSSNNQNRSNKAANGVESEQMELFTMPYDADPSKCTGTKCETKECCICMCEFDVEPLRTDDSSTDGTEISSKDFEDTSSTIVRTQCGHLFHKECLKGWVGGIWSANPNSTSFQVDTQQDWAKRKARQIHCPLCRTSLKNTNDN